MNKQSHLFYMQQNLAFMLKLLDEVPYYRRLFGYKDKELHHFFDPLSTAIKMAQHTYLWHLQRWKKERMPE